MILKFADTQTKKKTLAPVKLREGKDRKCSLLLVFQKLLFVHSLFDNVNE